MFPEAAEGERALLSMALSVWLPTNCLNSFFQLLARADELEWRVLVENLAMWITVLPDRMVVKVPENVGVEGGT